MVNEYWYEYVLGDDFFKMFESFNIYVEECWFGSIDWHKMNLQLKQKTVWIKVLTDLTCRVAVVGIQMSNEKLQ